MRFIIMLGMAIGLASAAAMTPIERRQCSTQRDGCCLKQGHCETCYFGEEPYDCNCECLERGLCPCTGWYGKTGECFSWYSPDGHVSDIKFTAKTLTYYKASTGPGQILGMRPGPPPSGYYDYHLVDLLINYWHSTGPATHEDDVVMRGAAPSRPATIHDYHAGQLYDHYWAFGASRQ
ncbi:hypothetical protein ARSEF1564_001824 [Beauveria bassiana]